MKMPFINKFQTNPSADSFDYSFWGLLLDHSRVCIVGDGDKSGIIQKLVLQSQKLSKSLVGRILLSQEQKIVNDNSPFPLLGTFDKLGEIVKNKKVQQVIIVSDDQDYETLIKLTDRCLQLGLNVCLVSDLLSRVSKCVFRSETGLPILFFSPIKRGTFREKFKRIFDFVFALFAITVTLPLWLFIAIAIKLTSSGPVFYRREVIGINGRIFTIYKFRSMFYKNDDTIHQEYMKELITNGAERDVYKITNDPRVTYIGRIIRKFSLDELPQFLNVLKGDMSVVGPRQCTIDEFQHYKEWHKRRVEGKPGITGLWQVRARSEVNYDEMVMLDLYYIKRRNFLFDLKIMIETIPVMLGGNGAY